MFSLREVVFTSVVAVGGSLFPADDFVKPVVFLSFLPTSRFLLGMFITVLIADIFRPLPIVPVLVLRPSDECILLPLA